MIHSTIKPNYTTPDPPSKPPTNNDANASIGVVEDLLIGVANSVCVEMHQMAIINSIQRDIENAREENDQTELIKADEHMQRALKRLDDITDQRRKKMKYIEDNFSLEDGDERYWCLLKHHSANTVISFEVIQAGEDLLDVFISERNTLAEIVSEWLGIEFMDCMACLSDKLKEGVENVDEY